MNRTSLLPAPTNRGEVPMDALNQDAELHYLRRVLEIERSRRKKAEKRLERTQQGFDEWRNRYEHFLLQLAGTQYDGSRKVPLSPFEQFAGNYGGKKQKKRQFGGF